MDKTFSESRWWCGIWEENLGWTISHPFVWSPLCFTHKKLSKPLAFGEPSFRKSNHNDLSFLQRVENRPSSEWKFHLPKIEQTFNPIKLNHEVICFSITVITSTRAHDYILRVFFPQQLGFVIQDISGDLFTESELLEDVPLARQKVCQWAVQTFLKSVVKATTKTSMESVNISSQQNSKSSTTVTTSKISKVARTSPSFAKIREQEALTVMAKAHSATTSIYGNEWARKIISAVMMHKHSIISLSSHVTVSHKLSVQFLWNVQFQVPNPRNLRS